MLISLLTFAAGIGALWLVYKFIFKAFANELEELGYDFYGPLGKIIMIASCVYFIATTFFIDGTSEHLPTQMLIGLLVLTPGYILFFLRCFSLTRNIAYTAVALIFLMFISIFAGYFVVGVIMLVIGFFIVRLLIGQAFGGGGGGGGRGTCPNCGRRLSMDGRCHACHPDAVSYDHED